MSETPNNPGNPGGPFDSDSSNAPIEGGNTPPPPPLFNDPVNPPPPQPPPPVMGNTPYTAEPGSAMTGVPNKDERNWGMFAHLSALVIGVLGMITSIPAFGFIGPLVIYLVKKDESPFIADQAKEALNFNITVGIAMFGMWVLMILLVWTIIVPILMLVCMAVVGIGALIFIILAAIKASEGQTYRYPVNWRIIK